MSVKTDTSYSSMKSSFSTEIKDLHLYNVDSRETQVKGIKSQWSFFNTQESEKRAALEQALRDKLVELLYMKEIDPKIMTNFMEFLILLCNNDMIAPNSLITFVGDILDSTPIPVSESLFEFVEKRVSLWKSTPFFVSCKNSILRMCNDLLRRLSKAQNTKFCGRILLFLAMFFPFSERSGLNIVSEFNVDTFMKYGIEQEDLEEEPLQTVDIPIKLDSNFYSEFWSLQEYFRSPTICLSSKNWKDFVKTTDAVLTVFRNYKIEWDQETSLLPSKKGSFFTKYLTSHKLLLLQLSDTDFRRTIYLQFLILFQFLHVYKSNKESLQLSSEQIEWVKNSTQTVHDLISESPPDGKKFLESILFILKREDHWCTWKAEGCQPLKKIIPNFDPKNVIKPPPKKKTTANLLHQNKNYNKLIIPKADGPEIIDMRQDYLKYLPGRNCCPKVTDFLAESILQSESPEPIELKDKKVSDPRYCWIALKLLSLKSPFFFSSNAQNPILKLPEFVDHICRKIYREQNPGLLLPPLMPAPKTVSKPEVKKEKDPKVVKKSSQVKKTDGKVVKASPPKVEKKSETKDDKKSDDKHKVSNNKTSSEKVVTSKTSKNDKERKSSERKREKSLESIEKNNSKQFKKEKSPGKRKRNHDSDVEEVDLSPAASKKSKDKKDKSDDRDEDGPTCPVLKSDTIAKLAKSFAGCWKKVAEKLGYQEDEIAYFESSKDTDYSRAVNLLLVWTSDQDDATPESLRRCMKTLGLIDCVKILSAS